jgi:protoporphyrinogen oxidase
MRQSVLVLGGGAAGVSAAHQAATAGLDVTLLEQAPQLGGLHRSQTVAGRVFDIGAFFFCDAHELLRTFPGARASFVTACTTPVRITPTGSYDTYPMSFRGYLRDHGLVQSALDLAQLVRGRVAPRRPATVPGFVESYLGRGMYRRSGLKTYIERLYGLPDGEIALEFAAQRLGALQELTATQMVRRWIRRRRADHGEVVVSLARHPDGFAVVYGAIARELEQLGVQLTTGVTPTRLQRRGRRFVLETDRGTHVADHVISTVPVRTALQLLRLPQEGQYETMTLHSLFFRGRVVPGGSVFYNFTPAGTWKRATVFSRLYGALPAEDHFTVEVTSHASDGTAAHAEDFIQHATALGFVERPELVGHLVTPDAYPLFRRGQSAGRAEDRAQLTRAGIHLAGRQGRFEYLSSSQAAQQAKSLVLT